MKKRLSILLSALLVVGLTIGMAYGRKASATVPGINTLVSVNDSGDGQGGNDVSGDYKDNDPSISADGKYVIFTSTATNLVSGDTNGVSDAFVRNLSTGTTTRVDVSSSGVQANDKVTSISISSSGRYVVYTSQATNLVDGQTTPYDNELYIHDMTTGATTLISQTSGGTVESADFAYGVSSDGRFILFTSSYYNFAGSGNGNLFMADLQNHTFQDLNNYISSSGYRASDPHMSCDGSFVVFNTMLQLVPSDTNGMADVYLVDLRDGQTTTNLTSDYYGTNPNGAQAANVSCNGDYISIWSKNNGFAPVLVSSTNTYLHLYVYDRINSTYSLADQSSGGSVANGAINPYTGIDDFGDTLFSSAANNLSTTYPYANQIWLHNNTTGVTDLISKNSSGAVGNNRGSSGSISADGSIATYYSSATNLIGSDTNGKSDVFTSLTGL